MLGRASWCECILRAHCSSLPIIAVNSAPYTRLYVPFSAGEIQGAHSLRWIGTQIDLDNFTRVRPRPADRRVVSVAFCGGMQTLCPMLRRARTRKNRTSHTLPPTEVQLPRAQASQRSLESDDTASSD